MTLYAKTDYRNKKYVYLYNIGRYSWLIFCALVRFQFVTLMGLWIIPMALCVRNFWWRFVISWAIFSFLTVLVMRRAMVKPVAGTTPRYIYGKHLFRLTNK